MIIQFSTEKLRKTLNDRREIMRQYGQNSRHIERRLSDIRAASSLDVLYSLPGLSCHELSGDRAGQIAVNVGQPFRLIFKPINDPLPLKEDGGLDRKRVTAIVIIEITNYH